MSFVILEFLCPEHGRFESLERRAAAPDAVPCPVCSAMSPWTISAPVVHQQVASVVTGKSEERPPHALDTRPLADGESKRSWHKRERQKVWETVRNKHRKDGLI